MFRVIVAVLILSAAALGQPRPNPFIVLETPSGNRVSSPRVTLRDTSLADVFWVRRTVADSEEYIEHAVASLTQRQLIRGPDVIQHTENWSQQIGDVISRGQEGWAAVLYELRLRPFGNVPNRLFFAYGGDTGSVSTLLDSATQWFLGCDGWSSSGIRLVKRVGGGWIMSWIRNGCRTNGQWSEPENSIQLAWMSSGFVLETRAACCIGDYLYGPDEVLCVSADHDTVITLSLLGNDPAGLSWQPFEAREPSHARLQCATAIADFRETLSGRLLALTKATPWGDTLADVIEIARDGTCSELHTLNSIRYDAIAFHPDHGWAILSVSSSFILLSRIDTTGAEVQPLGVFYERGAEHVIVQADVTIADEGRVVVAWTERADSSQDTSILKVAWVGWNTYLGTTDPHFITPPSSFSLSAFPNPFNSELEIRYDVPRTQKVELAVYNLLGQKVASLYAGVKSAGSHSATWSPRGGSGIYFVTLKTPETVRTTKVVYLR